MKRGITPREEDFSRWYTDVILSARLADYAPVKGCMVIRPYGFALWERMQASLDRMFKETGHENAYFPLLIPESFLHKEAEHVEGFAPECAVVTHGGGKELEEPLVIRPTSETIIWSMYKKWIMSYRDLPLLINQWCNVLRWELRTRLFLRTTEFLWQEGHTAHATAEEAEEEALRMLGVYKTFAEDYVAMPVIAGKKSEKEKFAGALHTYTIEALMQDGKALQAGTSHNLGQNFAKAFDVTFQNQEGKVELVWATSWGMSTRMIGALIMTHGDDRGLVLPPRLAPLAAVFVPIFKGKEGHSELLTYIDRLSAAIGDSISHRVDAREEYTPGWKFNEWERAGVPVRIEVGPRDLKQQQVVVVRRDTGEKKTLAGSELAEQLPVLLEEIQNSLYARALGFLDQNTHMVDNYNSFKEIVAEQGGFLVSHWCGSVECETRIKEDTMASIRCIPIDEKKQEPGPCVFCGKSAEQRVYFAKAY
ncbi:MAG: proline--tRNA ligase [Deltaproteobacteria bacterium]|nr:proline--tRNA ligase [Deltaproteobacteria bacterium]MBW2071286.1 proline--tRNA ligase [Deltaproteobacteria bacterium]